MRRLFLILICCLCCTTPAWADDAAKLPDEFLGQWISQASSDFGQGISITPGGHIEWIENPAFKRSYYPNKPKVFEQDSYQVIAVTETTDKDTAYLLVKHGDIPRYPFWDPRRPYWYVELVINNKELLTRLWVNYLYNCGVSEDAWNNIQHLRNLFHTAGPCKSDETAREPFMRDP